MLFVMPQLAPPEQQPVCYVCLHCTHAAIQALPQQLYCSACAVTQSVAINKPIVCHWQSCSSLSSTRCFQGYQLTSTCCAQHPGILHLQLSANMQLIICQLPHVAPGSAVACVTCTHKSPMPLGHFMCCRYILVRNMAAERANLFCVFLRIPRPTVVAISKQPINLGEGDDDEDEGDDAVQVGSELHELLASTVQARRLSPV